jgi:RNA polymerase sigma-70 factor (ECF subfamily)
MRDQRLKTRLSRQDDHALVALIRNRGTGWQSAFSILVYRHRDELMRLCQARLANRHDAEDAVQETILRAYRGVNGFKGDASFRTWVRAIAQNQCNTLAARRARHVMGNHVRVLIELEQNLRLGRERPSKSAVRRVHRTLEGLSQPSRDVLMLRFFSGLSIEQIAYTLGIGLSAAKMRLYRASEQFASGYRQETAV